MNAKVFCGWQSIMIALGNAGYKLSESMIMTDAQLLSHDRSQVEALLSEAAILLKIPAGVEIKLVAGFQTYTILSPKKVEI